MLTADVFASAPRFLDDVISNVPPVMEVAPANVFTPDRIRVFAPDFSIAPAPPITRLKVIVAAVGLNRNVPDAIVIAAVDAAGPRPLAALICNMPPLMVVAPL
jgi:hypothetical protein